MANTWGSQTWSFNQWNDLDNVSLSITGISTSSNLGSPLIDTEVNQGWGSDTWGTETWGLSAQNADVTGIALSSNLGSIIITANASADLTGEELTGALTTPEASSTFVAEITGQAMTMDLTFDPEIVSPTGQELTNSLGKATLDANTIVELTTEVTPGWGATVGWSEQQWGQASTQMSMSMDEGTVDPSPDAAVTGIGFEADLAVGTVIIGEANVVAVGEGIAAGLGLGTLDAVTLVDITGISMSTNLGSIAEVTGTAIVNLTGFGLTTALGTNTTLIWNQVDTGTAPVDPPGWVEVAA